MKSTKISYLKTYPVFQWLSQPWQLALSALFCELLQTINVNAKYIFLKLFLIKSFSHCRTLITRSAIILECHFVIIFELIWTLMDLRSRAFCFLVDRYAWNNRNRMEKNENDAIKSMIKIWNFSKEDDIFSSFDSNLDSFEKNYNCETSDDIFSFNHRLRLEKFNIDLFDQIYTFYEDRMIKVIFSLSSLNSVSAQIFSVI